MTIYNTHMNQTSSTPPLPLRPLGLRLRRCPGQHPASTPCSARSVAGHRCFRPWLAWMHRWCRQIVICFACISLSMYVGAYLSIYLSIYVTSMSIYVHMYLCIYICIYLCVYVSIHGCVYLCIYETMYLWIYVSMCLCMHSCIYVSLNLCIYDLGIHVCTYLFIHVFPGLNMYLNGITPSILFNAVL